MSANDRVALIAGVTGVAGFSLANKLIQDGGWKVYGISRRKSQFLPAEVIHIACDMSNLEDCERLVKPFDDITHVFYTTWVPGRDEEKCCEVNGAMLKNLLDNVTDTLQHVTLLLGEKYYIWNGQLSTKNVSPFKETTPRLEGHNFFYSLEDTVISEAKKRNFTWGVSRANMIIGVTGLARKIAVYASICKHLQLPFVFFGGPYVYGNLWDCTDADLLADHMLWLATEPQAANQAFNITNGDIFRWKHMWKVIAEYFDLEPVLSENFSMAEFLKDKEEVWQEIIQKHKLCDEREKLHDFFGMAFSKYVGALETFKIEQILDMNKSRELGFSKYKGSEQSFTRVFDALRKAKMIP